MKIAIAGASCFIGKKLAQAASNKNWDVIAIVRDKAKLSNNLSALQNVHVIECNMDEYESLGNKLRCVDCFIYLTWDGRRGEARNDHIRQEHSYRCGMAAVKSVIANGCKKIVTVGSQAEYGLNVYISQ